MQSCKGFETVAVTMLGVWRSRWKSRLQQERSTTKMIGHIIALVDSMSTFQHGGISVCAVTNFGGPCEHP
jgi:hypothetical protein